MSDTPFCRLLSYFAGNRYENPGWPSSFTLEQLAEIRKFSLARLICDNSDDMHDMQLQVFEKATSDGNPRYVPCRSNSKCQ